MKIKFKEMIKNDKKQPNITIIEIKQGKNLFSVTIITKQHKNCTYH